VFKTNGLRILLIALHDGAKMSTHTANGMISVQVLEGKIQFSANQQTAELNSGQMIDLHECIPQSVLALQE
jgi:quercetin dioxygenase-like cupin family protein